MGSNMNVTCMAAAAIRLSALHARVTCSEHQCKHPFPRIPSCTAASVRLSCAGVEGRPSCVWKPGIVAYSTSEKSINVMTTMMSGRAIRVADVGGGGEARFPGKELLEKLFGCGLSSSSSSPVSSQGLKTSKPRPPSSADPSEPSTRSAILLLFLKPSSSSRPACSCFSHDLLSYGL